MKRFVTVVFSLFCILAVFPEPLSASPSPLPNEEASSKKESPALPRYGKLIPWEQAKQIIPNKTKFSVIDAETGLTFNVQRRAGKYHADVQPLTEQDTMIMKQIYGGEWSWRRRAIWVKAGDELLAASMNGMPHGGDGIPGNGFKGHFCIHFQGSATHKSKSVDPAHQLMVHKAAGKLNEYIGKASPEMIADMFFIAASDKQPDILELLFGQNDHPQLAYFSDDRIAQIRRISAAQDAVSPELLIFQLPVKVSVVPKGKREEKTTYTFRLKRTSPFDRWVIDAIDY
nr:hypothetical protein [Paenibacillus hamazuiensis]